MDVCVLGGDLHAEIDRETVLKTMDCYEDSPVYEKVIEEYEEILEDMKTAGSSLVAIRPWAIC